MLVKAWREKCAKNSCTYVRRTDTPYGNGVCTNRFGTYGNTEECGFEDGNCIEFNKEYPGCNAVPSHLGDGACDYWNNNTECKWDGGDCL